MRKAVRVEYARLPNTVLYEGFVEVVLLSDNKEAEPLPEDEIDRTDIEASMFEVFLAEAHDMLQAHPDYALVFAARKTGSSDVASTMIISEDLRVMLRDDLEKALSHWAPLSRTVHVRERKIQNAERT